MEYLRTLAALTMLAVTSALLVLTISIADSFAQNDTVMSGNQSSSAINDTSISNETDAGNISAFIARVG